MKLLLSISALLILFYLNPALAANSPSATDLIQARLKPVGQVNIQGSQPAAPAIAIPSIVTNPAEKGKQVYEAHCVVCHASGVAGAPKFGDATAWKPRITTGLKILIEHVTNGYKAMPPKGTCMECSPTDLQAAVEYMVNQAKGK